MNMKKAIVGIAVVAMGVSANADGGVSLPKYAPNREITGAYDRTLAAVCENGTFVGEKTGDVIAYRGVPYAQQPVGKLRWKAPLDPLPSKKVYEAVHFGKSCLQPPDHGERASLYEQGEDCLTLCVYRNTSDPTPGKPVMMFIHGGGYCLGGTCDPLYDGRNFVAQNPDVILVVITYRFGMMGYIDLSQFPDGAAYADSVNLAQLDQIAALKWLKGNAAAFGGDPDRITIFGESAGGGSVSSLIVSAEARKYFRRAIPMSGVANYVQGMGDGFRLTRALVEKFGAKSVADLVKVDFAALQSFWWADATKCYNFPTANGVIIPEDPVAAWTDPALKDIEVMQGVTRNEWRYFLSVYAYDLDFFNVINRTMYEMLAEDASKEYRADAERLMKVLEKEYGKDWAPAEFVSGHCFRAGQFFQALSHAKNGGKEFMYRIDKVETGPHGKMLGASHGVELPYFFGNFGAGIADTEANRRYARMLQRMWIGFAKTGDPSLPGVEWPTFDGKTRKVMILAEEGPRVESDPEGERTDLEQRMMANPKYRFVKGLAPVHARIIARDGSAQFEAVMRKRDALAEKAREAGK